MTGGFCRGDFCPGGFFSGGIFVVGFFPGGFCRGDLILEPDTSIYIDLARISHCLPKCQYSLYRFHKNHILSNLTRAKNLFLISEELSNIK